MSGSISHPTLETDRLPAATGDLVHGKYRLQHIVGSSGMGVVFAAQHEEIEKTVAVKFLLPRAGANDALPRFRREAKVMAKIHSDHVVRVMDYGTHVGPQGEAPFIVMEFLEGDDLARVLKRRGPMPLQLAIEYVLQACHGLSDSHAVGVVHRDLKPSNLFLAKLPDGREVIKVIDFGVAKYRGVETNPQLAQSLTHTQVLVGSPRYMAPEQIKASRDVDARADVWSLALILYELLSGRPAFKAASVSELFVVILTTEATPVAQHRPDLPPAFGSVLARALAKDPDARIASMADFAKELLPFAEPSTQAHWAKVFNNMAPPLAPVSLSSFDTPSIPDDDATAVSDPQLQRSASGWAPITPAYARAPRARRPPLVAIGAASILVGGLTTFALLHKSTPASTTPSAPATNVSAPTTTIDKPMVEPAPPPTTKAQPPSQASAPAPTETTAPRAAASTTKTTKTKTSTPVTSAPAESAAPPPPPTNQNLFDDPK